MSQLEAMSCKLSLLDGEDTTRSRLMMTEVELENPDRLQNLGKGDRASFNDMLCTAWGLLLRCYTGQDNVSFHFGQGNVDGLASKSAIPRDRQSIFRMEFCEQESLSTCVARAKDSYADNERGVPSLVSTVSDSRSFSASHYQNTHVWVEDASCEDTQDVTIQKVF